MGKLFDGISCATQGTGNATNIEVAIPDGQKYDRHQLVITVVGGTPSGGTVTVRRKARGSSRFLALKNEHGVAVTIPLATEDQVMIDGGLDAVQLDIADLAGSGVTGWYATLYPIG